MNNYGICHCGNSYTPMWFKEYECNRDGFRTGRWRYAVDYLYCEKCGHTECVDDSFDGPWYKD